MAIFSFNDWLNSPQGQYILQWEQEKYDQLVADLFGFNAVQIGMPQIDFLRTNRMPLRVLAYDKPDPQTPLHAGRVHLKTVPHHLPFGNASVDLLLLPHLLEFHDSPHQILREVERVLVPEGSLIITGFNPYSLWGLRRRFSRAAHAPPPWRGQYLSVPRLRDWLTLLGLESHSGSFGCYAPPFSQENRLQRWRFIELAGHRWWPYGGAVYILQAIKRVQGMRLILPSWHERMARAKALAGVKPAGARVKTRHSTQRKHT